MSGRFVSPQPSKETDYAAAAAIIPDYRGPYHSQFAYTTIASSVDNVNGTTLELEQRRKSFRESLVNAQHSEAQSSTIDEPADPPEHISKMKAKAKAVVANHTTKSSTACTKVPDIVPTDEVESTLETMFESDSVSTPPAPVQFCKTVSDLVGESVEKILKSPMKTEEGRTPLSNGVGTITATSSSTQNYNNTLERNKNSLPHSNGRVQPAKSQLETALTSIATNCDKSIKAENAIDPPNSKKEVNKDETYVEVESELAKMFAGIEDSQSTSAANTTVDAIATSSLPGTNDAPLTSSQPQPSTSRTRKRGPRKRTRKPKANSSSSKFTKTKQSSKRGNTSFDGVNSKRVPVIHIEGPKENPTSVQIINSNNNRAEEEVPSESRTAIKRKAGPSHRPAKKLASDYVLKKYVPDASDSTWICIFCKRSPYTITETGDTLGDLFGPYFVRNPDESITEPPQKKIRVDTAYPRSSVSEEKSLEIWAHEDCMFWAPGVHLIGSKLIGLEQAVWDSLKTKCAHCEQRGANIVCRDRKCKSFVHYLCAMSCGWSLDLDKFISVCNLHADPPE